MEESTELQRLMGTPRKRSCLSIIQWSAILVLQWNIIVSLPATVNTLTGTSQSKGQELLTLILLSIYGGTLLLYPLFGWIADVCIKRYTVIGTSLYLIIIGVTTAIITSGVVIVVEDNLIILYLVGIGVSASLIMLGQGVFRANAIQFGCHLMIEASSQQLSKFIHWYYWTSQVGSVIVYYIQLIIISIQETPQYSTAIIGLIQGILTLIGIITFHMSKRYLNIESPSRQDPVKTVCKVLHYSYKHKYPQNRSAFTYWEEQAPSRIDVGKERYGGPFTTEEVEDTKTFLRILFLLISLFGLHAIATNTQAIASEIIHNTTTNVTNLTYHNSTLYISYIIMGANTSHLTSLTAVLFIPLYQLLLKPFLSRCHFGMLKRIWAGLLFAVLSSITALVIAIEAHKSKAIENSNVILYLSLLAVPQMLNGMSDLLVFLTALEFILAQSPYRMQGLLIGLWYLLDVIDVIIKGVELNNDSFFFILPTIRLVLTILSLVLFSFALYFYKYRDRDNVVNSYHLVADKVERTIANQRRYYGGGSETSSELIITTNSSINSRESHRNPVTSFTTELTH